MQPTELPLLITERLTLRLLESHQEDIDAIIDYYERNRDHLHRFDGEKPEQFYTPSFWRREIQARRKSYLAGLTAKLVVISNEKPHAIVGVVSLSNIVRGAFHAGFLGFNIDGKLQGQGLMREALQAKIDWSFGDLNLHRLMANYNPANKRSQRLLESLGFQIEGYARNYLRFNGVWEDHVLTSLRNPRWRPPKE